MHFTLNWMHFFQNSPTDFKKQKLNDGDLNMLGKVVCSSPLCCFIIFSYWIILMIHHVFSV